LFAERLTVQLRFPFVSPDAKPIALSAASGLFTIAPFGRSQFGNSSPAARKSPRIQSKNVVPRLAPKTPAPIWGARIQTYAYPNYRWGVTVVVDVVSFFTSGGGAVVVVVVSVCCTFGWGVVVVVVESVCFTCGAAGVTVTSVV